MHTQLNDGQKGVIKKYKKLKSIDTSGMSYIRKNELKETIEDIEKHYFGLVDIGVEVSQ